MDASLESEIRVHLQEQIDQYLAAGMSPEDARAAAQRAFGSVMLVEEQCRDTRRVAFVEHLGRDLRYALRSLVRQPMLVVAAASSIAVAVGANTTIVSLVTEVLFAQPSAVRPDRLVEIRMGSGSHVSYRQWRELEDSAALGGLVGYNFETSVNWAGPNAVVSLVPMTVTANFFDVIGPRFALGRGFTGSEAQAERDPMVVVITHRFWHYRLDADPQILGKVLTFNARPYTVVGVLSADTRSIAGLGLAPEVYLPLGPSLAPDLDTVDAAAHVMLVGRLRDGQSVDASRAALVAAGQRAAATYSWKSLASVSHVAPTGSLEFIGGMSTARAFFAVLLVAVGLILAIACANVAGLLLSRLTPRNREMAVRVALGASRRRLVQQQLAEGFWLAVAGMLAGLALMKILMGLVSAIPLPLIPRPPSTVPDAGQPLVRQSSRSGMPPNARRHTACLLIWCKVSSGAATTRAIVRSRHRRMTVRPVRATSSLAASAPQTLSAYIARTKEHVQAPRITTETWRWASRCSRSCSMRGRRAPSPVPCDY